MKPTEPGPSRRAPRIQPFVAPCRVVHGGVRLVGYVTDLSTQGCQVASQAAPPPVGAPVTLEVRLGHGPAHTPFPAEVMWVRGASEGTAQAFGLEFRALDDEHRRALQSVADEFHRRAAEIDS